MRDRNHLSLQQFHIQLSKGISLNSSKKTLELEEYFSHKSCLWRSDTKVPNSTFEVILPRSYREIRSLAIASWFFPENLRTLIFLELEKEFTQFNFKQQLELKILRSSKENCVKYLYLTERYSGSEIFGNLLGNDLRDSLKNLKLRFRNQPKAKKKVFRRGPKDKGSRRSDSSIRVIEQEIRTDVWIKEKELKIENRKFHLHKLVTQIKIVLENYREEES